MIIILRIRERKVGIMKNKLKSLSTFLLIFALIFTLIPTNVEAASKVKINKTKATVYVGKTTTLKVSGTKKTVKWTTSNKKVANVSSKGKVTAKKAGSATITAKVSGKSYKCKVTVKNPYLNKSKATLKKGKTLTLKLTGATAKSYKSSNTSVATVSNKGKITAKSAGTATITCTASNKKTYTCKVTVKSVAPTHTHDYERIVIKEPTCTSEGVCAYKCSCGEIDTSMSTVIDKLEHEYYQTATTPDTCIKKGTVTHTCAVCGHVKTKEYAPYYNPEELHVWDDGVITTPATCKSEGVKTYTCTVCKKTKTEKVAKLTTHTWDEGVVTTPATCTENGVKTYTCTVCGETKTETIEAGHTWTWNTNENTRTRVCSTCGEEGITEEFVNGVWGYFDREAADELFNYVNRQRAATTYEVQDVFGHTIDIATVPALTNFDDLYDIAKQRAVELATDFSHNLKKTDNENIARGNENAQACFEAWCYSSTHARTIIDYIYTKGSCAVFYYDSDNSGENLYPYYVLVVNKN